ncbi:uncharacterized protein LOC132162237 [Corylus avellana]|uniref:uncharacterized protein LOC132162237 n=1 Tax=Corylus avellana TaxID=13451 RepID=UPI001E239020|nr:uncharacterized protein LOC132162237 [Corylus avellana]
MTRKKVKLSWIVNDSARKASLKKRRIGLLKKVSELTILCGVSAFAIIYGPGDKEAEVWPSHQEVQQLLARFQSVPEMEQYRKMMNQDSYLKERATKFREQLRKQQRKNKEMEMGHLMQQIHQGRKLDELEMSEMTGLAWFLEQKMKDGGKRVEYFPQNALAPSSFPPLESAAPAAEGKTPTEGYMWDQWFIDMVSQNENVAGTSSSIWSNMGLPPHAYVGDPFGNHGGGRDGIEMGLPHGNYKGSEMGGLPYGSFGFNIGVSDIGLQPHGSFGGIGVGGDVGLGLPYHGNMNVSDAANDMGLSMPHVNIGSSSGGSEMGLPQGFFGGGSIAGTGSDAGELPYDATKPWPNFFSP